VPEPTRPPLTTTGLARAAARVGDRWTLLVIESLLAGPRRFGELADELIGIAPNILTKRLRQLEQDGLIVSSPYSERPVRLAYELTAVGKELAGALALLANWGTRADGDDGPHHHRTCGTALELRHWCPTCERVVDQPDDDELTWT
jgi:DNA-binding HxlR family transcriptional regulator